MSKSGIIPCIPFLVMENRYERQIESDAKERINEGKKPMLLRGDYQSFESFIRHEKRVQIPFFVSKGNPNGSCSCSSKMSIPIFVRSIRTSLLRFRIVEIQIPKNNQ
jgi:hypothetical protein